MFKLVNTCIYLTFSHRERLQWRTRENSPQTYLNSKSPVQHLCPIVQRPWLCSWLWPLSRSSALLSLRTTRLALQSRSRRARFFEEQMPHVIGSSKTLRCISDSYCPKDQSCVGKYCMDTRAAVAKGLILEPSVTKEPIQNYANYEIGGNPYVRSRLYTMTIRPTLMRTIPGPIGSARMPNRVLYNAVSGFF